MQRTYSAASIIYIKVDPQASTHPIEEISPARKEIIIDEKNMAVGCILLGRRMKAKLSEYILSVCIVRELMTYAEWEARPHAKMYSAWPLN